MGYDMTRNNRRGKEEHEKALQEYIEKAKKDHKKIIDLCGKSPDAIEVIIENGKIKLIAVEVLPIRFNLSHNIWKKTFSHSQKRELYRMFDEVKIITYKLLYTKP